MEEQLLPILKSNLRITWDEEDLELKKLLTRSMAYLNELCGTSFDFSAEGQPKFLMMERCRYVYNNAADEYEKNFHHELSRLILTSAIKIGGDTSGTA